MDPISTAIIAAVSGGVAQPLIKDLYTGLMKYIRSKYGEDIPQTMKKLEKKPASGYIQGALAEELNDAGALKDQELLKLAAQLTAHIKPGSVTQKKILVKESTVGVIGDNVTIGGDLKVK